MAYKVVPIVHYPGRDQMHCGKPKEGLEWSRNKDDVTCPGCLNYIGIQRRREHRRQRTIGNRGKIHFGFIHKIKNLITYCNCPGSSTRMIAEVTCKSCLRNIRADLEKANQAIDQENEGGNAVF